MAAIHGTPVTWYNPSAGASFSVDPIAIAAGTNLVYYCAIWISSATVSVNSLDRGAQSASIVGSALVQGSQRLEVWRIIAPATGSAGPTLTLSASVSGSDCIAIQWVVSNADQTAPNGAFVTNTGTYSTSDSLNVTSASTNDLVIEVIGWKNPTSAPPTLTPGAGQTSIGSSGFYGGISASWKAGAAGTVAVSEAFSPALSIAADFAHLAFNITHNATGSGPVLSSPTIVSTGNTIATVRVTTDTAPTGSSILAVQVLPAADATPTAAAILASPTQTITSGASGARDFNLTGLTNGTAYKAHFAQTGPSNVVSTASFTPSTVPGAPTIGTAVAGNAQATVNGTAPGSTGGSAITGYRSTATPGGSTVTGASLPITHTGLTNGAAYTFTLAAQNANGYGAESAASNSVTPSSGADVTPPTLGGSITIGTVTSSSIQASWSAGSDNVAVTSYEVSSNGGGSYSDVGNVLTYTFTGLAPSTSYALRVRAKDAAGNVSSALSATQSTGAAPSSITGTFTLPGADDRTDKQEVTLHTVQALSSLTVDGNGATVNGAPASLAANGFFRLRFDAQSVAWYRVG